MNNEPSGGPSSATMLNRDAADFVPMDASPVAVGVCSPAHGQGPSQDSGVSATLGEATVSTEGVDAAPPLDRTIESNASGEYC